MLCVLNRLGKPRSPFKVLRKISELHASSSPRRGRKRSPVTVSSVPSGRKTGRFRRKPPKNKPGTGSRADVPGERGQNSGTPVVIMNVSVRSRDRNHKNARSSLPPARTNDCPGLWRCERGTVSFDSVRENHGHFVRVWNLSRHLVRGRRGPSLVPAYLRGTSTERSQEPSTHERTRSFPAG